MPKLKTHRGAAKRFRKTKTGKLKKMSPNRSHLLGKKARKRKRRLKKQKFAHKSDRSNLRKLLPYF